MIPKITVVTINYNNKIGLERTFRSVFSQTYKDFEYIVIDGGSKDGSRESIEQYADEIDYWVSEPDKGIYNAMNKGISAAKGEYIIFINSGDELYQDKTLENSAPQLNDADVISGNLKYIGENREWIGKTPETITFKLFYYDSLGHPCTFFKNNAFEKVGFYDEDLKIVSDWKWFMMAFFNNNLQYKKIHEIISIFYLDGISTNPLSSEIIKNERLFVLSTLFPYLAFEYKTNSKANLKLEGYESSRIIRILRKVGFLKGLS